MIANDVKYLYQQNIKGDQTYSFEIRNKNKILCLKSNIFTPPFKEIISFQAENWIL